MKLNIQIDLSEIYSMCEETAEEMIKDAIKDEIGKAVRRVVKSSIDQKLFDSIVVASKTAQKLVADKALKAITD